MLSLINLYLFHVYRYPYKKVINDPVTLSGLQIVGINHELCQFVCTFSVLMKVYVASMLSIELLHIVHFVYQKLYIE